MLQLCSMPKHEEQKPLKLQLGACTNIPMISSPSFSFTTSSSYTRLHSRTPSSPSKSEDYPTEILPGLYISDLDSAENPHILSSLRISHIVSAMCGTVIVPNHLPIQHHKIPLVDGPFSELAAFLPTSTSFLREALEDPNARVLVHCFRGVSRSASVIAAFLISEYGWSSSQAVNYIKSKRCIAEPNPGFLSQLKEYSQTVGVSP